MLEVLDPVLAEGLQLGERGGIVPWCGHDDGAHDLGEVVGARQADHGHVADAGMAGDGGLDLDRRHGAGARPDEVAHRTEDRQEVLTVDLADLAGVVPAVDDGGGRRLRVGEVAVEQQRAARRKAHLCARR